MIAKTMDAVESQLCHEREEKFTPPLSYQIKFDSTYEHSVQISATTRSEFWLERLGKYLETEYKNVYISTY